MTLIFKPDCTIHLQLYITYLWPHLLVLNLFCAFQGLVLGAEVLATTAAAAARSGDACLRFWQWLVPSMVVCGYQLRETLRLQLMRYVFECKRPTSERSTKYNQEPRMRACVDNKEQTLRSFSVTKLYYIVYLLTISPVLRFSPHVGLIGAIVADYTGGWATLSSRALTRRALDASIEFRQY